MKPPLAYLAAQSVDIGEITQLERQAVIFARLDALHAGGYLRLLYDHNPQTLRDQFDARFDGSYEWLDMKAGPLVWRVQITRRSVNVGVPGCDTCYSAAPAAVEPSKDAL